MYCGVVADLVERVDELASTIGDVSPSERSDVVTSLVQLRERVDAVTLAATADWDRDQAWATDGSLTPVAWLTNRTALTARDAKALVRSSRLLDRCPLLAKSLAHGEITTGHVAAWARQVTPPRAELFDDHADALVEATRRLSA